jgi:hypothetical protein
MRNGQFVFLLVMIFRKFQSPIKLPTCICMNWSIMWSKLIIYIIYRGVNKIFKIFTRQVRKQLAKNIERVCKREKKLVRLASGFVFLLTNPEFYSHLASWRVVIRTPATYMYLVRALQQFCKQMPAYCLLLCAFALLQYSIVNCFVYMYCVVYRALPCVLFTDSALPDAVSFPSEFDDSKCCLPSLISHCVKHFCPNKPLVRVLISVH